MAALKIRWEVANLFYCSILELPRWLAFESDDSSENISQKRHAKAPGGSMPIRQYWRVPYLPTLVLVPLLRYSRFSYLSSSLSHKSCTRKVQGKYHWTSVYIEAAITAPQKLDLMQLWRLLRQPDLCIRVLDWEGAIWAAAADNVFLCL